MPLISYALAAYIAGLLSGFADSLPLCVTVVVAAGLFGVRRRRAIGTALSALSVAGMVAARDAVQRERACSAAAGGSLVRLVLDDSASPGAFVRARLADCDGFASLGVERGEAEAGSLVLA